ncbi:MAG: formate dehydrogenase accessory protein FdhE [Sulfuritalea sp.]|nr:formate dehydrogenase accessory protein FdhE [Sulfuritalea sp.]
MTTTTPIIPIKSSSEPPHVIAPDAASIFATRAQRFEQLAAGHSLGDWLGFLAVITRAQHDVLQDLPPPALPAAATLALAREHRMPLLPAQSWSRDPAWRTILALIIAAVSPAVPEQARQDLARLAGYDAERIEALAERVLHTELYGDDAALLPYVAAALQVLWTAAAARLGGSEIAALDVPGVCPCCGFLPVASVVRGVGEVGGLRYLHCALCNTEWNLVRVKCSACDATEGISYRHLETEAGQGADAVRAETCESCKSYLKIVYTEKGAVDPVADDLATLALDILVDEAGYARSGPNLLLVPGG